MESVQGTKEHHLQFGVWMDERRIELRLKWVDVARRARMTPQHLVRIRKGRIAISWDAAAGIESALLWEPGSVEAAVLRGEKPRPLPEAHTELTARRVEADYPPGWTSDEEVDYQEKYPAWNPLLKTQDMEFTRHAYRIMRDEFRKLRALEQFTQGIQSSEDSDHSPDRGTAT